MFSFGGSAYLAAWYSTALQRAWGPIGGFVLALALMFAFGLSFLGIVYLVLAYLVIGDGWGLVIFYQDDGNDVAIGVPVIVPPAIAGLLFAVSALV